MACAYLEGDRTVTCAIRQQLAQTRRVFDLNSIGPHLYREENEPDCKGSLSLFLQISVHFSLTEAKTRINK